MYVHQFMEFFIPQWPWNMLTDASRALVYEANIVLWHRSCAVNVSKV